MFSRNSHNSYRIEENMLIVNETIAPYDKQIMRSSNTLFITDLAVEVPITQELRAYDQYYFHHLLKKQIISEIESCHPEVGLQILKQMPNLQIEHYQNILSKISIRKLTKILMNNDFLIYLCQSLRRVTKLPSLSDEQSDRLAIAKLNEPYQRAIYLLSNIQESGGRLKQILEITSKKLVYDIVDQKDFIEKLAFCSNSRQEDDQLNRSAQYIVEDSFLQKLQEFAILIHILQKNTSIQWQIIQYYIDKLERKGKPAQETNLQFQSEVVSKLIETKLFNKQCLNFIAKHFDHFFQYNRRDLLQVLVLILTHNKHQFWEELICYKDYSIQQLQSSQIMQVYPNNQNTLREFMINNYLNKDSYSWSQSLSILEKLNDIKEAESMLTDFYSDLVQYPMKVNVVELITAFIKIIAESKKKLQIEFKFLLSSFVDSISSSINQIQADYFNQAKKIQTGNKYLLRLIGVPMYPKIKTALLCAYIRAFSLVFTLNLCDHLSNFTFEKSIAKILKMQFNKNSLIHGAKVQFIRHLKKNASKIKNCDIVEHLNVVW